VYDVTLAFNPRPQGWSYGRGDAARHEHSLAAFGSVRDTDYGSAACVMVPRALFVALDL